jgi:hypothetical protein
MHAENAPSKLQEELTREREILAALQGESQPVPFTNRKHNPLFLGLSLNDAVLGSFSSKTNKNRVDSQYEVPIPNEQVVLQRS